MNRCNYCSHASDEFCVCGNDSSFMKCREKFICFFCCCLRNVESTKCYIIEKYDGNTQETTRYNICECCYSCTISYCEHISSDRWIDVHEHYGCYKYFNLLIMLKLRGKICFTCEKCDTVNEY